MNEGMNSYEEEKRGKEGKEEDALTAASGSLWTSTVPSMIVTALRAAASKSVGTRGTLIVVAAIFAPRNTVRKSSHQTTRRIKLVYVYMMNLLNSIIIPEISQRKLS